MRHRDFGLFSCDEDRATPGYTLFSPLHGRSTLLLNLRGEVVHRWDHSLTSIYAYVLENGNLLWAGKLSEGPQHMGGRGGLLREYAWNGDVIWEHRHVGQHHDFRRLPNGNTIFLGWEVVPPEIERRIAGGLPGTPHPDGCMYGDFIYEIDGTNGRVVWEWHASRDMDVANYPLSASQRRDEFAHANAISPLANGDILISFRRLNMIGVIDRQTRCMKWEHRDDSWGMQHDCELLANGNITLFANGCNIATNPFSRVVEFDPRTRQTAWEYRGKPSYTFFSPHISGAQRLWTGNTLICEGQWGRIFEVTPRGHIVWEYVSPFMGPDRNGDPSNEVFRAYRYAEASSQIRDRIKSRFA